jgi:hypothetical protein
MEFPYKAEHDFREALKIKLDSYLAFFKDNFVEYHSRELRGVNTVEFIENTNKLIVDVLDKHYEGKLLDAYELLFPQLQILFEEIVIPDLSYLGSKIWFRISKLTEKEMNGLDNDIDEDRIYHIPFDQRTKVNSYRYSIAGFPSLYLGENLHVCSKEVGIDIPVNNNFIGSAFRLREHLKVIRFLRIEQFRDNNLLDNFSYLMLFPFLLASSFKVFHINDPFKPEYIISQMLLSFVRKNKNIDGIMYPSTKIDYSELKGEHPYNLVLPVKTSGDTRHCEELRKYFDWAKPQFLNKICKEPIEEELPKEIKDRMGIENNFFDGTLTTYENTIYGKMEAQLVKEELYTKPNKLDSILGKKLRNVDKNINQ